MSPPKKHGSSLPRVALSFAVLLALGSGLWLWISGEAQPAKPSGKNLANIFLVDAEKEFPEVTPLAGMLPGEFERQDALLIGWPDRTLQDPTKELVNLSNSLNQTILEMISQAQTQMRVVVAVPSSSQRQSVLEQLKEARISTERVDVVITDIDTRWVRDFGPYSLRPNRPGEMIWVASQFFCEVGARTLDEQMAKRFCLQQSIVPFEAALFLDGGNLQTDGQGLVMTTTQTLALNRLKLGYGRIEVGRKLRECFGARRIVFLEPLDGEITGHVDMFLTMPTPNDVVLGEYPEEEDAINSHVLDRNAQRLREIQRDQGPLTIVRVPMPPRGANVFGGTYTNVVYANGVLLVPKFGDVDDAGHAKAVEIYQHLLPDWKIVSVEASGWLALQGSIHCLTKNLYRYPSRGLSRPRA